MQDVVFARTPRTALFVVVGLLVIAGYVVALNLAMQATTYDTWGGLVIAPALVLLTLPLARHVAKDEDDPLMVRIIMLALVAKLLGAILRLMITTELYDRGDFYSYAAMGEHLAALFRQGIFTVDIGRRAIGTGFIEILTGVVFVFTGRTLLGGFLVYSWFGFWGLYFFYRAFRVGFPQGDYQRYALLLFFLPSLLFWSSSIGKEAWLTLTIGLSVYGVAKILQHRRGGYLTLSLGLLGTAMVRPHMALLVCVPLVVAYLLRRRPGPRSPLSPIYRVVGIVVMIAISAVVLQQVEQFFEVEGQGVQGVGQVLDRTAEQTSTGGSQFDAPQSRSLVDLPRAVIAVLFRPFPWEARNAQALLAAFEGALLLGLFVMGHRRLRRLPAEAVKAPYLVYVALYVLMFCAAFSTFGNFGILTRQRIQVYPFVLVLLALPPVQSTMSNWWARTKRPVRSGVM